MRSPNHLLEEGEVLSGCVVIGTIGSGGMGAVYKARDENLGRLVAIKVMHPTNDSEHSKKRFLREAAAIARCDHPGIIKIYSFGEFKDKPYFVMEFVEGKPLRNFIAKAKIIKEGKHDIKELQDAGYLTIEPNAPFFLRDPLSSPLEDLTYLNHVELLIANLADALAYAHSLNLVHRDIKPSNILICKNGNPKIVDFGLAKHESESDLTKTQEFLGTITYASPEQFMGKRAKVSHLSDIYSLGVVFYELSTLTHPFHEEDMASIMGLILQGKFDPPHIRNQKISSRLEGIILKCLERKPENRFSSMKEIADSIRLEKSFASSWKTGIKNLFWSFWGKPSEKVIRLDSAISENGPQILSFTNQESPARTSETRKAAQIMICEARELFFHSFGFFEAIEKAKQAIDLDPENVDAIFLFAFSLHSIGDKQTFFGLVEKIEKSEKDWAQRAQLKYEIVKLIFVNQDHKLASQQAFRFQHLFPGDPDILLSMAVCEMAMGNIDKAIQCAQKLVQNDPENNLVAIFLSECYESIWDFEKALEILQERIVKYPKIANLRIVAVNTLFILGKLDAAEEQIVKILELDPANAWVILIRARIHINKDRYPAAIEDLRKVIGMGEHDWLRAVSCFVLSRVQALLGNDEGAIKFLSSARALKPQRFFPSFDEAHSKIENLDLSALKSEIGPKNWLEPGITLARKVCFETLHPRAFSIGNFGCTSCFELNIDGSFFHGVIYSHLNLNDSDELSTQLWVPEIPSKPFVDSRGNILKVDCKPVSGPIGGFMACVRFDKPWVPGEGEFICTEFEPEKASDPFSEEVNFEVPHFPILSCRHQAFIVLIPKSLKIIESSEKPDETINSAKHIAYVYFRFLFARQNFPLKIRMRR